MYLLQVMYSGNQLRSVYIYFLHLKQLNSVNTSHLY